MDGIGRIDVGNGVEGTGSGGSTGQRARKRDSLFLSARMKLGDEATVHEVRVRNLSEGGLMVELDRMVEPGTPAELEMRGVGLVFGQIAWCTRGRLGIALDHPIDPARARKPVGGKATTGSLGKPLVVAGRR